MGYQPVANGKKISVRIALVVIIASQVTVSIVAKKDTTFVWEKVYGIGEEVGYIVALS